MVHEEDHKNVITGYKKKRLGHGTERFVPDIPRASWQNVLISEILGPISMAIIVTVAYMFVGAFPDETGKTPPSALVRILVVAVGPMVLNACVLLLQFLVSVAFGPSVAGCCSKFGAWMAASVHLVAVVGLVAFFEFLWFLERWNGRRTVLGVIAVVFIQRAINKFIISTLLSRESKNDETNRVWWSGGWFGKAANNGISNPAREFLVKVVELSLWSSDFILGHILLFFLAPPILIPFVDKLHSTMLFWLRPSKQIRGPIYTFKQRKQRRIIVAKYGLLFLIMLAAFLVLILLPIYLRTLDFSCYLCDKI